MNRTEAFSIKEAAYQSGLSEDTIRYYEKIQLLPQPNRKSNGHRVYDHTNIEKMKLILCLKKTGLSLEEMRPYVQLSLDSDLTDYPELYHMLQQHQHTIQEHIQSLQQISHFIDIVLERTPSLRPPATSCTSESQDHRVSLNRHNLLKSSVS